MMVRECLAVAGLFVTQIPIKNYILLLAFGILFAGIITLSVVRIHYGVEIIDESFYLAIAYRFAQGDIPLVDEYNIIQTASFITYPLVKAYLLINGSTEGIMLYIHNCFLLFLVAYFFIIYLVLQSFLPKKIAVMAALPCLFFVPFNLYSFSYNSMGSAFLTLGLFLGIRSILIKQYSRAITFLSGLCHGLCVLAYPSFIIPVGLFFLIRIWHEKQNKKILLYIAGGLLSSFVAMPFLIYAGVDQIKTVLNYINSIGKHAGGLEKFEKIYGQFYHLTYTWFIYLVTLAIFYSFIRIRFFVGIWVTLLILISFIYLLLQTMFGQSGSLFSVFYFSIIGVTVYLFIHKNYLARRFFLFVLIPSIVAAITGSWTSSNGLVNIGLGAFSGSIATSVLVYIFIRKFAKSEWHEFFSIIIFCSFSYVIMMYTFITTSEGRISELKYLMDKGPFKGIFTTLEKKELLDSVYVDIKELEKNGKNVLFYDDFPAGYLFTSMRAASPTLWIFTPHLYKTLDRESVIKYMNEQRMPDYVFRINGALIDSHVFIERKYLPNEPVDKLVYSDAFTPIIARKWYTIFRRSDL